MRLPGSKPPVRLSAKAWKPFLTAVLLASAGVVWGAGSRSAGQPKQRDLAWPAAPLPPRVRFVQCVEGPADLGIKGPLLGRTADWITGQGTQRGLKRPFGLTTDDQGHLLVTDTGACTVSCFDLRRRTFKQWNRIGPYQLSSPVAVAAAQGVFYVVDSELGAVIAADMKGDFRWAVTNGLSRPTAVVLAAGRLIVADAGAHCLHCFDGRGQALARWGSRGDGPGEFNFPTHLAVDAAGRVLVTDAMNGRVQILDAAGKPVGILGSAGDGGGQFGRPKGVAADRHGHIYVADALSDNVQIFNQEGQLLLRIGAAGQAPGEFWMPAGVAVGDDDRVYVADTFNGRLQIFQYINQP